MVGSNQFDQTSEAERAAPRSKKMHAIGKGGAAVEGKAKHNVAGKTAEDCAVSREERLRMIAEAAYFNAEKRGFVAGGEISDWIKAEKDLMKKFHYPV